MATSPYLLHVNTRPTTVSNETWTEWYTVEHLPDLVNSKTSTRAAFYKEIGYGSNPPQDPRPFLALYQTDFEEPLKSDNYAGHASSVRRGSEIFKKGGATSQKTQDNGDFDARNYSLIQNYDPNGVGEKPSPVILTVEMNPSDPADFEAWYREEHLALLAKLPGYHRSLRFQIGPDTPLTQTTPPKYLAIHYVDDVSAFEGKEAEAANSTPWTKKHIAESKPFIARGWKLVHAEGY